MLLCTANIWGASICNDSVTMQLVLTDAHGPKAPSLNVCGELHSTRYCVWNGPSLATTTLGSLRPRTRAPSRHPTFVLEHMAPIQFMLTTTFD